MKTLIVYYSFTANNEMLAKHLQQRLGCDMHRIEEVKPRQSISILFDLMFNRKPKIKPHSLRVISYDLCIFIAPIWAGRIATPMKTFLDEHKRHINRYAFITACGGSGGQKERLFENLTKTLEQEPIAICELWINDLLTKDKKDTIRYTSGYRLQHRDLKEFENKISRFLKEIQSAYSRTLLEPEQASRVL